MAKAGSESNLRIWILLFNLNFSFSIRKPVPGAITRKYYYADKAIQDCSLHEDFTASSNIICSSGRNAAADADTTKTQTSWMNDSDNNRPIA